jgi:hypothetical protein
MFKISSDSASSFYPVFNAALDLGLKPVVCDLESGPYQFVVQCNPSLVTLWSLVHSHVSVHEYLDLAEVWTDLALWNKRLI